jgi:hypothetical protein
MPSYFILNHVLHRISCWPSQFRRLVTSKVIWFNLSWIRISTDD